VSCRSTGRGAACVLAAALVTTAVRPAGAQSVPAAPAGVTESRIDLSRILAALPEVFEHVAARGYSELFRLLETVEVFRLESEIDRFVGRPRELNDTTTYKLSLLPFNIAYPIYPALVAQMTRLDSARSNRIYTVTPDSVSLVDLRLRPVGSLEEFQGLGRRDDIARGALTQFSARELSDITVFVLAQYPFFPQTDDDWRRTKRRVARAAIPIALAALATGALFDAGALAYSGPIVRRGQDLELRYYGQFRDLGIHWHPYLRVGLAARAHRFEAAAGFADQINPTLGQPDRAVELAVRGGWLNQLEQPLGLDTYFEAALKRSVGERAEFVGDLTRARAGFFVKREQAPIFPNLAMRGSLEAESNLEHRLHMIGALGFEKPYSGITTVFQATLTPALAGSGLPEEARLNLFFVGTMEPLSQSFSDEMSGLAHQIEEEWAELGALDQRREDWDQGLLLHGTAGQTPEEARAMLGEMEQLLIQREDRIARLANHLADYLASRRRAYSILGRARSEDELHGPLDATVLLAARSRILVRLQQLSEELTRALGPLGALKMRMAALEREIDELAAAAPGSAELAGRRRSLDTLEQQWASETERIRRTLAAHDQLHAEGARILTEMDRTNLDIRHWDTLDATLRTRVARLTIVSVP